MPDIPCEREAPVARARGGFTLVEMLTVVVMAGIIMSIALPRFIWMRTRYQVDAAAQQITGDLRRARAEALRRNTSVALLKTGTTSYQVQYIGARSLPSGVQFTAGSDSVRFISFGVPATGAASFTVGASNQARLVSITASGLVRVQ